MGSPFPAQVEAELRHVPVSRLLVVNARTSPPRPDTVVKLGNDGFRPRLVSSGVFLL